MQRVIDVHTHVYLPRYMEMLRKRTSVPRVFTRDGSERLVILPNEDLDPSTSTGRMIGPEYYDKKSKLEFMDNHGIHTSVLSIANPWLDFLPAKEAETIATELNTELQQICKDEERFIGLGILPTLSKSGSIKEIEHMATLDQIKGFIMGTHGLGKGLDDPELEPVLKAAADHKLLIFLHPHYGVPSSLFGERENGHVLPLALGFPFETTIVLELT